MSNNNLQNEVKTAPVGTVRRFVSEQYLTDYKASVLDAAYPTKAVVTSTVNGLMSLQDKKKLDGIQEGATNYIHPQTHNASMITIADSDNIFEGTNVETALKELFYKVPESSIDDETITKINQQINTLTSKQLEILIHLDLANNSGVDGAGYWFDTLSNDKNILSISGLKLDKDRCRIFGENGEVTFDKIEIPFTSDQFKYVHELDDNFVESIMSTSFSSGTSDLVLDKYSYELK